MATKRANGEGSIFEDKDRGGYIGFKTIGGKRRKVRAKTKTDVRAKFSALEREAHDGPIADGNTTVGQLLAQWQHRGLAGRDLAPSTRVGYDWSIRLLTDELGSTRLRSLDVTRIEAALDRITMSRPDKPMARRTIKIVRSTLAQALDFAVRRRMIAHNPARLSELPPEARPIERRNAMNPTEVQAFWAAMDDERMGPLFQVMLATGLRPGEALGLCWDAVDLDAGVAVVRRAIRLERGAARLVDELKTASSYRTIALAAPAIDALRRQRVAVAEMKLAATTWATNDPGLVFPGATGRPWNPKNLRNELDAACARHELPRVRPHELRHSCATVLSDAGVPLELIADLLGHTDIKMLSETYRHRVRPSADAALGVMDRLVGGA